MEIGPMRRQVEQAVWLLLLLHHYANQEGDEIWWPVCGGAPISDERIAVFLDVRAATAQKFRKRLERTGYIRTEPATPLHRKFWVLNLDQATEKKSMPDIFLTSKLVH
jgi:hypothetical protein